MTPHDLSGLPLNRGDIVACYYIENKICLGVISEVNCNTGVVVVRTVVITRNPVITETKFLFPANQVVIVPEARFWKPTEEQALILAEHERLKK